MNKHSPLTFLRYAHNLPEQVTHFVGREKEIAEIGRLLVESDTHTMPYAAPCRLITLVGVGGIGKTRLALQAASHWLDHFPDGAWLVDMGVLVDPELVPQAVAKVLGVCADIPHPADTPRPADKTHPADKNYPHALVDYLRSRQVLLILEQCDHLLDACAQLAETLLRTCPNLKILATSREALRIPGETTFPMPSLSLPVSESAQQSNEWSSLKEQTSSAPTLAEYTPSVAEPISASVSLFVERATSVQPDFLLTEQNTPVVAQICQRLDGLPLAIELAAMRVNTLPVDRISDRIENRFRLLTGSPRTALSRPQIIRSIFDWSYDILSPSERTLLSRLAVFTGGWTMEAATSVCTDDEQIIHNMERRTGIERRVVITPWNGLERRSGIDRRSLTLTEVSLTF